MKRTATFLLCWAITLVFTGLSSAAEKVFYYHSDPAGTPMAISDDAGNVVWRATYEPFGQEHAVSGSLENNERFIGKEKDKETGLVYINHRYFKPEIGRFISPDEVTLVDPWTSKLNHRVLHNPQLLNRYAYGLNNPYTFMDPDGLSGILIIQSSGNGGSSMVSGHSWISYKNDSGGTTTYGTWGNNPMNLGNGLHENLEAGRAGDASRGTHIDDAREARLMGLINAYKGMGPDAWQYGAPCSTFARDAWEAGTGEHLNSNYGPISNPTTLKESIISANGGVNHLNTTNVGNGGSSKPSPSSSSHSSGSLLNSLGSLLQ